MNDCSERMSHSSTELRLSNAEDDEAHLQAKVNKLETKNKTLEDKIVDLETRSRLNNLRLVGRVGGGCRGTRSMLFFGEVDSRGAECCDVAVLRYY